MSAKFRDMKSSFHIFLFPVTAFFLVALLTVPVVTSAQRFSHSGAGGGGRPSAPPQNFNRPSAAPASHPAPAVNHPSPAMSRPAPAPVENRPTINGGSYNAGNHNYNQHTVAARPPVNVHQNVTVQRNVTVHENVNVYHNHYQAPRAYVYHPYHPYYWGHNWHPVGFFAASLATDAILLSIANQRYYYDQGVYYQPSSGGYAVVAAPIGALVSFLPPGYETTSVGNDEFFYYGGTFYIDTGNGYQVVAAPVGAIVTQIPDGAVQQNINGESYLLYNNVYYQPISQDGQDAYQVVQLN